MEEKEGGVETSERQTKLGATGKEAEV